MSAECYAEACPHHPKKHPFCDVPGGCARPIDDNRRVIIVDLDNTIAADAWRISMIDHSADNSVDKYHRYHLESEKDEVRNLHLLPQDAAVVVFTARPFAYRQLTLRWLRARDIEPFYLFMRPDGDQRGSVELKRDMLQQLTSKYGIAKKRIECAYDDRADVIAMFESEGIPAKLVSISDVNYEGEKPRRTAADILAEMAITFRERNAVYGDNYKRVGDVMVAMFPNGINLNSAEQFNRWHLFELMIVKLTRYANSGLIHQDSIHDSAVYAAMLESITTEGSQLIKEN